MQNMSQIVKHSVSVFYRWQECFYRYHVFTLLMVLREEWYIVYYSDLGEMQANLLSDNHTIATIDPVIYFKSLNI